jgi:hypothetical protein
LAIGALFPVITEFVNTCPAPSELLANPPPEESALLPFIIASVKIKLPHPFAVHPPPIDEE